jgi:hypothetical protein
VCLYINTNKKTYLNRKESHLTPCVKCPLSPIIGSHQLDSWILFQLKVALSKPYVYAAKEKKRKERKQKLACDRKQ